MATFRCDIRFCAGKARFKAILAFQFHCERMNHTTMKKVAAGLSTLCLSAMLTVPAFAETGGGAGGAPAGAGTVGTSHSVVVGHSLPGTRSTSYGPGTIGISGYSNYSNASAIGSSEFSTGATSSADSPANRTIGAAGTALGTAASNTAGAVGNVAANTAGAVGNVASTTANAVGNVASTTANAVGNVVSGTANAAGTGVSRVTGATYGADGRTGVTNYPYGTSTYSARTTTDGNTTAASYRANAARNYNTDWGWLGLLGLIGLAGLFGRNRSDVR